MHFLPGLILIILLFTNPLTIHSHSNGQLPFFKINGTFTDFYHIPSTSLYGFELPEDSSPKNYLINEKIEFEIDTTQLPVPADLTEKTKFLWEFGDGSKAEGLKNIHSYEKPGTYFMKIKAGNGDGFEPEILQSITINILPRADYKLPQATIHVNGSSLPDQQQLGVDFSKEITFDGSKSDPGSSEITEYFWDMGNQNSQTGPKFSYKYPENPFAVLTILRIKTKDGFIVDGFVQMKDSKFYSSPKPVTLLDKVKNNWAIVTIGGLIILVASTLLILGLTKVKH